MTWTSMLKELAAEGVFCVKPNTREKGAAWARIVNHLNQLKEFTVTPKALRDRFKTLSDKLKAKLAKEKKASGGGKTHQTEVEKLLEDLIEVKEQTERDLTADGNRRARDEEKERAQAVEMRDRAMERFGETRKRGKGEDGGKGEKEEKKRRSGSDTVEFLRAKMEAEQEMKEKEREEKKEDRKAEKEKHDLLLHQLELQRKGQEAFQLQQQQQQQFQLM